MTYEQAMHFWYGRINYEQRSPHPSDLKLDRMHALAERLGNPHLALGIVHVAGSKGKGSTSAMLAAVAQAAGYRTGLFTSPHLVQVEERIQIDGKPISPDELASLMELVQDAVDEIDRQHPGEEGVTFFEVATALGFLHFARRRVDLAVVEVGLGGRFDSTNVCQPLLSIITSISFDHTQQLGNTLDQIAMEKAGIVKPGRMALSGARAPAARARIEQICRERGAPLAQLDADFSYGYDPALIGPEQDKAARVQVTTRRQVWPWLELGLAGEHQAANAALVVAAVEELRRAGLHVPDAAVAAGLADVRWPARLEVMQRQPLVLLDCAHNLASVEALLRTLEVSCPLAAGGRRFLIFAASRDKDLAGMLRLLGPHFDHVYLTRFAHSTRVASPEHLADLTPASLPRSVHGVAADAWHAAAFAAGPSDQIVITGSVFLAGELRPLLSHSAFRARQPFTAREAPASAS